MIHYDSKASQIFILSLQLCAITKALLLFNFPNSVPGKYPRKKWLEMEMFICNSLFQEGGLTSPYSW